MHHFLTNTRKIYLYYTHSCITLIRPKLRKVGCIDKYKLLDFIILPTLFYTVDTVECAARQ